MIIKLVTFERRVGVPIKRNNCWYYRLSRETVLADNYDLKGIL